MRTLTDKVKEQLNTAGLTRLSELAGRYGEDKEMAKSYSIFCFLVAMGYGCDQKRGEDFAEFMEAFFLATSIHDDIIDRADKKNSAISEFTTNEKIVLGDYFFIELAVQLAGLVEKIAPERKGQFLQKFKQEMMVVAKSQLHDQNMAYQVCSPEDSLRQSEDRGGSWGRMAIAGIALACSAPEEDVAILNEAANNIFIALTILDDLRDLEDDLANGIYSLAPCTYVQRTKDLQLIQKGNIKKIKAALAKTGAVEDALRTATVYAEKANDQIEKLIKNKEGMYWFQLKSFFGTIHKQLSGMKGGVL